MDPAPELPKEPEATPVPVPVPEVAPAPPSAPPEPAPAPPGRRRKRRGPWAPRVLPRYPWRVLVGFVAVLAAALVVIYARGQRPPPIGWALADADAGEPVHVRAGARIEIDPRLDGGRVVLGPVDLRLPPGATLEVVSETEVRLLTGSVEAFSVGGKPFTIVAGPGAGAPPPVRLPEKMFRATVAISPEGFTVDVRDGAIEFGPVRLGPAERAIARPGAAPEKVAPGAARDRSF